LLLNINLAEQNCSISASLLASSRLQITKYVGNKVLECTGILFVTGKWGDRTLCLQRIIEAQVDFISAYQWLTLYTVAIHLLAIQLFQILYMYHTR